MQNQLLMWELSVVSCSTDKRSNVKKIIGENMHNIDRTTFESDFGEYESDEFGYEYEDEFEGEGEYHGEMSGGSPFSEAEEMELAAELLNVTNEQELDQFIGSLFKKLRKIGGDLIRSPIGKHLGGIIKGAAKSTLPMLGGALGNFLIPGVGGAMGAKFGSAAGSMLGLELEGLSQEDQEFEIARQLVRFGGAAASNAAEVAPMAPPQEAAQTAAANAAQQYAPGLLNSNANVEPEGRRRCSHRNRGRWIRSGNKIIIIGA
jgi:hypothetical protein